MGDAGMRQMMWMMHHMMHVVDPGMGAMDSTVSVTTTMPMTNTMPMTATTPSESPDSSEDLEDSR